MSMNTPQDNQNTIPQPQGGTLDVSYDPSQDVGAPPADMSGSGAGEDLYGGHQFILEEIDAQRQAAGLVPLNKTENMPVAIETSADKWWMDAQQTLEKEAAGFGPTNLGKAFAWGTGQSIQELGKLADSIGIDSTRLVGHVLFGQTDEDMRAMGIEKLSEQGKEPVNFAEAINNQFPWLDLKPDTMVEGVTATLGPPIVAGVLGGWILETGGAFAWAGGLATRPGIVGNAIRWAGGTSEGITQFLSQSVATNTAVTLMTERDKNNVSSFIDEFRNRDDNLGKAARTYFATVPGAEWFVHRDDDSEEYKALKSEVEALTIDAGVGAALMGVLKTAGLAKSAFKYGGEKAKALFEDWTVSKLLKENEKRVVEYADMVEADLKDNPGQVLDTLNPKGSTPDAGSLGETAQFIEGNATSKPPRTLIEPAMPIDPKTGKLTPKGYLSWIRQKRALQALNEAIDLEKSAQRHFSVSTEAAKTFDDGSKFKNVEFMERLLAVADDEDELMRVIANWTDFLDGEPLLLNASSSQFYNASPLRLTGELVEDLKRFSTDNPTRLKACTEALAKLIGDKGGDGVAIAEHLLKTGSNATSDIDKAAQTILMTNLFNRNYVAPKLRSAVSLARHADDPQTRAIARRSIAFWKKMSIALEENSRQGLSAMGRGLQSAQINTDDMTLIKELADGHNVAVRRNPTLDVNPSPESLPDGVNPSTLKPMDGAEADPTLPGYFHEDISDAELARLDNRFSLAPDHNSGAVAYSDWKMFNHPFWKSKEGAIGQLDDTVSAGVFSFLLIHPSTWNRVFQSAAMTVGADSLSALVGASVSRARRVLGDSLTKVPATRKIGDAIFSARKGEVQMSALEEEMAIYGATVRFKSLLASTIHGLDALARPAQQELYRVGQNPWTPKNPFSYETIAKNFGDDAAQAWSTFGQGVPSRLLRLGGSVLGIPGHVLGAWDAMINHGALHGVIGEQLYNTARRAGMSKEDALAFVSKNSEDILLDAIAVNDLGPGADLLNKAGFTGDQLQAINNEVRQVADLTSMRATTKAAETHLTGKNVGTGLDQTFPFRTKAWLEQGATLLPVPGMTRSVIIPFGNTVANLAHRNTSVVQVWSDWLLTGIGIEGSGPLTSQYMREVIRGQHGVRKQALYAGQALVSGGLWSWGLADVYLNSINGDEPLLEPQGRSAQIQAAAEGEGIYGEFPLMGGKVSFPGAEPWIGQVRNGRNIAILAKLLVSGEYDLSTQMEFAGNTLQELLLPSAPMLQAPLEMAASVTRGGDSALDAQISLTNSLASQLGKIVSRPSTLLTLLPSNVRDYGRTVSILNDDPITAFRTSLRPGLAEAMGLFDSKKYNIHSYTLAGDMTYDHYKPRDLKDSYVNMGCPTYRREESGKYGQMLRDVWQYGETIPSAAREQQLHIPGWGGSNDTLPVDLQHWYNPTTGEHLWDVYNRYISEYRNIPLQGAPDGKKGERPLKELLEIAAEHYYANLEAASPKTHVIRDGLERKVILSTAAEAVTFILLEARLRAKERLQVHLIEHKDEYFNLNDSSFDAWARLAWKKKKQTDRMEAAGQELQVTPPPTDTPTPEGAPE